MDDPGLGASLNGVEPVEVEAVDEAAGDADGTLLEGVEFAQWKAARLDDPLPCLFLDATLRILHANRSAAALFEIADRLPGLWFTQFAAPSFDETRSGELFRAVRSATTGHRWVGTIERTGTDQMLGVYKVWVLPVEPADASQGAGLPGGSPGTVAPADGRPEGTMAPAAAPPRAFQAICLDITPEFHSFVEGAYESLLEAAVKKDNDTGRHVERVNQYARELALVLHGHDAWPEVSRQFIANISQVAALHDVGKIGTPDDILGKFGPLEAWEREIMQEHTKNGAYILRRYHIPMAREIALRHHERWDGTGYPYGLEGTQIPLAARIVAIADVYDALRMRRKYKEAIPHERAVAMIADERGRQFDPLLVDRFVEIAPQFARIFSELVDLP